MGVFITCEMRKGVKIFFPLKFIIRYKLKNLR